MNVIETPRLTLRQLEERDAERLFEIYREPGLLAFFNVAAPETIEDARAAIDLWHGNPPEAARGEVVKLGGGKPLFTVPRRGFHRELGRERLGNFDGFGV